MQAKRQGRYRQALLLSEQALRARQAELGGALDHPALSEVLGQIGDLLIKLAEYERAGRELARAEALAARSEDPLHLATVQGYLADLAFMRSRYTEAERLYEAALSEREKRLGVDHPDVADVLQRLGTLHFRKRRYEQAEAAFQRALQIRTRHHGADHEEVGAVQNSLAMLYRMRGELSRALELYQRALDIRERRLGPDHPELSSTLNNLAEYYNQVGDYARSEELYQRSYRIRLSALGPDHHLTGAALNNLAYLYNSRGDYARAQPLYERAIEIYEKCLGPAHSSTGTLINNLAELLGNRGDLERAEKLSRRALSIRMEALGPDHPNVADSLHSLGLILAARERIPEAVPLLQQAFDVYERHLRREGLALSDASLGAFLSALRNREEAIYALLGKHAADPSLRQLALTVALSRKGRSSEETARGFRVIRESLKREEDRARLARLRKLREEQAEMELAMGDREAARRLAREIDGIETELARSSRALRELRRRPPQRELIRQTASALPADAALIEYVAYQNAPTRSTSLIQQSSVRSYLALVLLPDQRTHSALLGPAGAIDAVVKELLAEVARPPQRGDMKSVRERGRALYRLVLAPLLPYLGGRTRLYLSTEGQLHLVPFAALSDDRDYLLGRFRFSYVTGGQSLLRNEPESTPGRDVVVFADPDFSMLPSGLAPLKGTRREAESIRRLFPAARLYLGGEASKEHLIAQRSPAILHVATHGVFLGEDSAQGDAEGRSLKVVKDEGAKKAAPMPSLMQPAALSSLVRSMLLLAGDQGRKDQEDAEGMSTRGMLTALEVAGMDLLGTQLIVLSACETGKGELSIGQGVYGLRRAFFLAGAQTVVTSLWRVSDQATQELMEGYYRHLLAGAGRAEAMERAALQMRRRRPHPYFWAPFIVIGDDRPLRL